MLLCGGKMSRENGNRYETEARKYFESQGFSFIAANVYVDGGEIDLVVQATDAISGCVEIGEVCIVEVKGRRRTSEWNMDVVSPQKLRRWNRAAYALLVEFEDGVRQAPLTISGFQVVLFRIESSEIDIQWNAFDFDLG